MSDREALIALRDAVVNCWFPADVSARDLGLAVIADETGLLVIRKMYDAFAGSVDAAIALLEAVLPKLGWTLADNGRAVIWSKTTPPKILFEASAMTPARAMLIATLNALIAETDQ